MKDSDWQSLTRRYLFFFIKPFVATEGEQVDTLVSLIFVTFCLLILINIDLIWCQVALVPLKCQILKCWHFLGKSKDLNELIRKGLVTQRFQGKMQFISADKKLPLKVTESFFQLNAKITFHGTPDSTLPPPPAGEFTVFSSIIWIHVNNLLHSWEQGLLYSFFV